MILASIPSPSESVWHLGPFPLRAYAFCIIAGVVASIWVGDRRFQARGGKPGAVADVAVWAIPFGLVGARLYHVLTNPELYFGEGREAIRALYIWEGGLGIWGAISLGAVGAYIGCRRHGIRFAPFADALAPGILLGQAIGRFGNWFNQELFGSPTDLPWGLEIDAAHRPAGFEQYDTFHPTFLYESIWNLVGFFVLIWADRRFRLGGGRVVALYVAIYTLGRFWIEGLRIDTAHELLGLRLNQWTSIALFAAAVALFVWLTRTGRGERETVVQVDPRDADTTAADGDEKPESAEGEGADTGAADEPGREADETPADETPADETPADGTVEDDAKAASHDSEASRSLDDGDAPRS